MTSRSRSDISLPNDDRPEVKLGSASPAKTRADVVVVGLLQTDKGPQVATGGEDVAEAWGRKLRPLLSTLGLTGKAGETAKVPTGGVVNAPLVIFTGRGKTVDQIACRRAAGAAARAVSNAASVALALPADSPALTRAAAEGFLLGGYAFSAYKSSAKSDRPGVLTVLTPDARKQATVSAVDDAVVVAQATATVRDLVNTPPGDLTPPTFADAVTAQHKAATKGPAKIKGGPKLGLEVLDESALADLGCGGILGVGQASAAPPRLVQLTWKPRGAKAHLALVGKGITFDSGGLSIKPAQGMTTMKGDMAGAAAVIEATFAIAELGLPITVSTFAPLAENMVSGSSMRPGDILTMYGGKTVEVLNTDAEGRLVLADALVRATETKPDVVVDVATLTGAMVVALGERVGGVLGTDATVQAVLAAAETAGEAMWPMPITEEVADRVLDGKIADVQQHDWTRWGSGLFAAAFLREFTDGLPWAHLDIAGPAYASSTYGHVTAGGTGAAVATLVELARAMSEDGPSAGGA